MPYPPPVPPANRTNGTVSADNHPTDHDTISVALTEIINHIATMEQTLGPIGHVTMWPGDTAPGNYQLCQGQAVARAAFPEVFAIVGTRFGAGDGSTTFNLPDYRGRVPCGVNAAGSPLSAGIGERFGTYDQALPSHQHTGVDHLHGISLFTGGMTQNHYHFEQLGTIIRSNPFAPQFNIRVNDGATIPADAIDTAGLTTNWAAQDHLHPINGATGAADRSLNTGFSGVGAVNMNIQPVLTLNFIIRMK